MTGWIIAGVMVVIWMISMCGAGLAIFNREEIIQRIADKYMPADEAEKITSQLARKKKS